MPYSTLTTEFCLPSLRVVTLANSYVMFSRGNGVGRPVMEKRPYNPAELSLEDASICCLCAVAAVERRYNATPGHARACRVLPVKYLDSAIDLRDLLVPPSNLLEALKGDRVGQFSVRINDQFRVCFHWDNSDARDVEIVDYH